MNNTLEKNEFRLANSSLSMNPEEREQIKELIYKLSKDNTFESIEEIHFHNISEKSFTVYVTPKSKGWRQSLSDKICRELNLNHLKETNTNRLFL